jgi:DNA polymerase III subunit delta
VLFVGADSYWRDRCRAKVIGSWISGEKNAWSVCRLSLRETEFAVILTQAQTVPMLCPRQVIIADAMEMLEGRGEAEREEVVVSLGAYLADPANFTFLILEAGHCDQRTRFYRLLRDEALVVELEAGEGSGSATVVEMARDAGCAMEPAAAELLMSFCGNDWARTEKELAKLATYAGDRRRIAANDVRRLVVSSEASSAWDLADALLDGQASRALEILNGLLLNGESGSKLVGALAWTYRKVVEAQELPQGVTGWQAAQRLGMRPDAATSLVRKAQRLNRARARAALVALAEADRSLKSSGADERSLMEFLIVRLCRPSAGHTSKSE